MRSAPNCPCIGNAVLTADGERTLAPLREIGSPIGDAVAPHPYTGWQAAFDPLLTRSDSYD